ncbi:4'-phosphopantetheinyl transferase family protein [Nocardioides bruguierae]|uniref:4'-phosphopantetheinyl transferase superfamily protein n=1 Tax=Nocardioides bruguierae TaxID=2945102 RepID=A0A9X2DAZ8_9ACTN|nr:4'-phosphopantetheinyl transferase superfamily protein [Nocardioides bruguierae]MCM0622616.1 4'-phosphopantetheinyl transferase superfamily protein [Nocardioides bruguierae]
MREIAAADGQALVLVARVQLAHQGLHDTWGPLSGAERERADRYVHEADRRSYESAHLLVREAVRRWCGAVAQPSLVLTYDCPTCGSAEHGRPRFRSLDEVQISLSHARGHVAAAVSARPIGVDVEDTDRSLSRADLTGFMTPRELAADGGSMGLLETWTRKEALVKAGAATLDEIGGVDVTADLCALAGGSWLVRSHRDEGWVLSVATGGERGPEPHSEVADGPPRDASE